MSRLPTAAVEQPTPVPRSAVVPAAPALDDLPPELRDDPFLARMVRTTPEEDAYFEARFEAWEEGQRLYGDETSDTWLAALLDGTHPLCRVPEPARR